jgi:hypothetical protein
MRIHGAVLETTSGAFALQELDFYEPRPICSRDSYHHIS